MLSRLVALFSLVLLVGCVEELAPSTEPLTSEDETPVFAVDLMVTQDYEGTPRQLSVALYRSLPAMGPPDHTLFIEEAPELIAGQAVEIDLYDGIPDDGDYQVYAVVYDVEGGTWVPSEGIDLVGETEHLTFDGAAVEVGALEMNYR